MKKAIILLSGGMDSAVTLYLAMKEYECSVLIFDYGQKAQKETLLAQKLARGARCESYLLKINLPWKGSALLDERMEVHRGDLSSTGEKVPDTYVPARNMIFLSFAVSFAEAIKAESVFIGAHQLDFSNYPDCRSEFFRDFEKCVKTGTKRGAKGAPIKIVTPIINKTKKEIVELGRELKVPFEYTWSCYEAGSVPCGMCESCLFRARAFKDLGIKDPADDMIVNDE